MVAGVKWKHIIGAILVTLLLKSRENCVNGHQTCSHVHPKYDEVSRALLFYLLRRVFLRRRKYLCVFRIVLFSSSFTIAVVICCFVCCLTLRNPVIVKSGILLSGYQNMQISVRRLRFILRIITFHNIILKMCCSIL
jgi:hypothetical protein